MYTVFFAESVGQTRYKLETAF